MKFDISYLPTDIITSWKRASLSSNFCSLIIDESNTEYESIVSTLVNELIEFSIKHGMNKSSTYSIHFSKSPQTITICLSFYLIAQQIYLLKCFIKKIKSIKNESDFQNILFSSEFSELGFSIYSLINSFNGSINITNNKKKVNQVLKTKINIKLKRKEA